MMANIFFFSIYNLTFQLPGTANIVNPAADQTYLMFYDFLWKAIIEVLLLLH